MLRDHAAPAPISTSEGDRREQSRGTAVLVLFAICCATASAWALNPYRYGLADQYLTIPFLKQWLDPALYPGDYVVAERVHLYSVFWPALAWLVRWIPFELPGLFFGLYLLALVATFWGVGLLGREVHGSAAAGLLAMFLLVFAKPGLAGSWTIEDSLLTRVVALPAVPLAILLVLRGRRVGASALLGLTFLIHPLTAAYALATLAPVAAFDLLSRPRIEALLCLGAFALLAAPVLLWAARLAPESSFVADPGWMELLRLRSPNHIAPMTWGIDEYLTTGLLLVVLAAMLPAGRPTRPTLVLAAFACAVVSACVASFVFTELLPITPIVQLQLFRSSVFLAFLAAVALAGRLADAASGELPAGQIAGCVVAAAVLLLRVDGWPFAVAAVALVALFLAVNGFLRSRAPTPVLLAVFLSLLLGALAAGAARSGRSMNVANAQPADWLAVQHWAREHTARDAWFIVPPGQLGFRVESERAIYGDWKDGTQAFFNVAVGVEWMRRMRRLGFDESLHVRGLSGLERLDAAFDALSAASLQVLATEIAAGGRPVYLVERSGKRRFEHALFENTGYAVVALSPLPPARDADTRR